MRLDFRLLVVDDEGAPTLAVDDLRLFLLEQGFSLPEPEVPEVSEKALRQLVKREGQEFDLVIVDYRLEQATHDGVDVLRWFRDAMKYTEMVFYTGGTLDALRDGIREHHIDGVFVAQKNELNHVLRGVAKIVIGKATDLTHTRGLAMAEVADMDALMENTLRDVLTGVAGRSDVIDVRQMEEEYRGRRADLAVQVEKRLERDGLLGVLPKGYMFTSRDRWMSILYVAEVLSMGREDHKAVLRGYDEEILKKRNMLAHVREECADDGRVTLRSLGADSGGVVIDEKWMTEFRRALRRHRVAIEEICAAIVADVRGDEEPENAEESNP